MKIFLRFFYFLSFFFFQVSGLGCSLAGEQRAADLFLHF